VNADGVGAGSGGSADRTWLVALAASIWGLDGLLRKPLASALDPATVVIWEHLIVVLVVLPFMPSAIVAFRRCGQRERIAVVAIGAGASATATALFTQAFKLSAQTGDFVTPLVLQKLQPLFAVLLAVTILAERLRPRFAYFALPALAGSWLLAFPQPLHVQLAALQIALLSIGAAALWAAGTVLGRLVSPTVGPRDLTVLRYAWGLPAALAIGWQVEAPLAPGWANVPGLVLLALVPGLLALGLYYLGLRTTAAARATFAEMAFPATAAIVGIVFLGGSLSLTQWVGFAVLVTSISALSWHERARPPVVTEAQSLSV
jgi:drug/metabolite transporter, DME family